MVYKQSLREGSLPPFGSLGRTGVLGRMVGTGVVRPVSVLDGSPSSRVSKSRSVSSTLVDPKGVEAAGLVRFAVTPFQYYTP